ncbi:MAG: glycine cleavage system aminomethyltransferase GcvT [Ignavibacterium sp.]|nr:glycine cleavage system aminomethyltransferase GcvT [Ignavibacterium sp.]MCX7612068.1 glycine cleavage system aminomethyltransferase GcvT [Ignavibacterium sp.]MDW8375290.1 glycine cleavage system aminomethyltransferase GcvT [Ignavibacteriales bacterium]
MKKTKLYDIHKNLNAKIVEFAGFEMPIQYSSIIQEHKAVRTSVGVFDVSHMGEILIKGQKALDFVQYITINDASKLFPGRVQYSAMCYEDGGIVDDLLIYKISEYEFMFVVNASNIEKDYQWMIQNNKFDVEIENLSDDYSLLAIQGPNSINVVQKLFNERIEIDYYYFTFKILFDSNVILSRTGYTGEIGFELYFQGDKELAEKIWNAVFDAGREYNIQPVGLGARDTLRLEMGYCLYGNDIDNTTNPIEAGLGWITKLNKPDFVGKSALISARENLSRKLVALVSEEKIFPRKGYQISAEGNSIGNVTSGTVSPTLEKAIALGYVKKEYSDIDTSLNISIRGKDYPAKVVRLPFIKK